MRTNLGTLAKYTSIKVVNDGRMKWPAKKCRAYLKRIDNEDGDRWVAFHADPLPLPWGYGITGPLDIPGESADFSFNVFHVDQGEERIKVSSAPVPTTFDLFFANPGRFRFHVMLIGDNFSTASGSFTFEWRGSFDKVKPDCFEADPSLVA